MAWYNDIGWWTGTTQAREAADKANQQALAAAGMQQGAAETLAKAQESGFSAQMPWVQKALQQLIQEYNQQRADISGGYDQALAAIRGGQTSMSEAARAQDAQRLGLVREGMGMDRDTLTSFMNRVLASQAPYQSTYDQLTRTGLGALLGGNPPLSDWARIQQEDAVRADRAALQRQGLEGSGMAAARQQASNRRIAAEDRQSELARAMQMLTMGLGGANLQAGTLNNYATAMGALGNRLSQVTPYDQASQMMTSARSLADLYSGRGAKLAGLDSQIPQTYSNLGSFYNQQITLPAATRAGGTQAYAQAFGNQIVPQKTGGLDTLGKLVDLYSAGKKAFG